MNSLNKTTYIEFKVIGINEIVILQKLEHNVFVKTNTIDENHHKIVPNYCILN